MRYDRRRRGRRADGGRPRDHSLGPRRWTRRDGQGWERRRWILSCRRARRRRCGLRCCWAGVWCGRRRGLRGFREWRRWSRIPRAGLASEQTAQELNAHRRLRPRFGSMDGQRASMQARGRAGRPLARLWTHGLPALAARGTVAKLCAQGAAPAKHRGTAGWLRADAPSQSPLSPRAAFLSTVGRVRERWRTVETNRSR